MDDVDGGEERHGEQPEPEEEEDLLVEQIDGQHALDRVAVHVGLLTDAEVALRDAGEAKGGGPVAPAQHLRGRGKGEGSEQRAPKRP